MKNYYEVIEYNSIKGRINNNFLFLLSIIIKNFVKNGLLLF